MTKRILLLLAAVLLCAAPARALDLKIATVAPEGSAWMKAMRAGGDTIRQRTDGRVNFKFYAGGVMGNDKSVLRKIRIGQLQGGAFTSGGLAEVYPDLGLYNLPLQFRSPAEVDYVRARLDPVLQQGLEAAGFVSFGLAEGGFALLMADVPVRSIDDMRGKKVWVPEGDTISYRVMESLGLAPVTLPLTDVMTGLQAGLINVIPASAIAAVAFQWYTRISYVTDTPLSYLYATLAIDRRAFSRLSAADQQVVREVMGRIYQEIDHQNRADDSAAKAAMRQQGVTFVTPEPAEIERWRGIAAKVADDLRREGAFTPALFDRFQQLLADYRRGGGK
jgi:TRAP-type transport system periplasmic protein